MKYAIIGAGIGGLTTALAFEQKGIDYHVFEKHSNLSEVGAGIWLAPNALQVLEKLEILEDIRNSGNSIDRITLAKSNLSPLSDNNQNIIKEKFGYSTIAIHRAELQKILFDSIPKHKISFGKSFSNVEKTSNNSLKLIFEDETEYESNFIIGADGINSKVRNYLFPKSSKRYSGQTCWRGVVNFELPEEHKNRGMELWGDQIRFGISNIGKGKVYWFAVALSEASSIPKEKNIKNKLLEMFSEYTPLVNSLIQKTHEDEILKNDIYDLKPLEKWYFENMCLIGDAAHATTPNLGQGGAQAIEDAYFISKLIKEESPQKAFEKFQATREQKVKGIVNQSWMTGKMAHRKYGKGIRNFLLKIAPKKVLEKKMIEMYSIE